MYDYSYNYRIYCTWGYFASNNNIFNRNGPLIMSGHNYGIDAVISALRQKGGCEDE